MTPAEPSGDPIALAGPAISPRASGATHPGQTGPLNASERALADAAWQYFKNNTQMNGLANSVDGYTSATMWDLGSSLAATVAADRLHLIDSDMARARLDKAVGMLATLPLFHGLCPNKAYETATGIMVDYHNTPSAIGCSAIDLGRLMLWLRIVVQIYPTLHNSVDLAIRHLNPGALVRDGQLYGVSAHGGALVYEQEGRLGYEQYAALGFALWGYDVHVARNTPAHGIVSLYGVDLPYDARDPAVYGAHNYLVSEPYMLDGIETGWNDPGTVNIDTFSHSNGWAARTAERVYLVQQRRFERTGILTARTEHQLRGAPFFVYDSIYCDGRPWATLSDTGTNFASGAAFSTKAAVALWSLYDRPYSGRLFAAAADAVDLSRGVREGVLESGGSIDQYTANTNGVILEALWYKIEGPFLKAAPLPPPFPTRAATIGPPISLPSQAADNSERLILALSAAAKSNPPSLAAVSRDIPLNPIERSVAVAAWSYFINNTQVTTGLVNAADNYASTTLWDTASALAAIYAANRLGLIDDAEARQRLGRALATISHLSLFDGICANKAYDTRTLELVNYSNQPAEIGCSAVDHGRLLIWMTLISKQFPALADAVRAAFVHLNPERLVHDGELFGLQPEQHKSIWVQEGRLGYEEYAARGFGLWGFNITKAAEPDPYAIARVDGIPVLHDYRDLRNSGATNYVLTEGVGLEGMELDWNRDWKRLAADDVYQVQERRYHRTGQLTARSEHQLAVKPNFVYDSIFANGSAWATLDAAGTSVPGAAAISFKAALTLWALWPTPYTSDLFRLVVAHLSGHRGIVEGVLETGQEIKVYTANNNGVILEALLFKVFGPFGSHLGT